MKRAREQHGARCGRRPSRAGFTLIEVLVAVGMAAVLAVAVYGSLAIAFNARRAAENAVGPVRKLATVVEMMREDLHAAVPPTGQLAIETIGEDSQAGEGAQSDYLLFYTAAPYTPWPDHPSGLRQIEYVVEPDEITQVVSLYRLITINTNAPVVPEPTRELICSNIRSFNLRYFDGGSWVDEWDSETQEGALPRAVEVTIELDRNDDARDAAAATSVSEDDIGPYITTTIRIPTGGEAPSTDEGIGEIFR